MSVAYNSLPKPLPLYLTILDPALRISYSWYTQCLPLSAAWEVGSCLVPQVHSKTKPSPLLLEFFLLSATKFIHANFILYHLHIVFVLWISFRLVDCLSLHWLFSVGCPQTHSHLSALCLRKMIAYAVYHLDCLADWFPVYQCYQSRIPTAAASPLLGNFLVSTESFRAPLKGR